MIKKGAQRCALLVGALVTFSAVQGVAQANDYFSNWPAGTSPEEVGKKLAEHFVTSPHQYPPAISYAEEGAYGERP